MKLPLSVDVVKRTPVADLFYRNRQPMISKDIVRFLKLNCGDAFSAGEIKDEVLGLKPSRRELASFYSALNALWNNPLSQIRKKGSLYWWEK